ncbi:LysR substrate-binding domain-containing protein [Herbaspirillum sp.]|uniref:LysR family transcriptional regulator n=1 Tax=Herbaspirillum sp. TaxID=1890675 RepID=UPI001B232106|nr:LysR substrate-binding domain-containing protein [Herbaspirillum sp.]MBO9538701.1 LysR family transcriptional regulator [Herbaspirillum sp.]
MISFRQLRYFVEIVEAGGYTRAAERLFIAQSALSRQVKELEGDLDVVLLKRDAKQFELTDAGQDFYERSRKILSDIDRAVAQARTIGKGEHGALRLLHSSSVPLSAPLGPTLNEALKAFPGISLEISQAPSEYQAREIDEGSADIGLARLPILRKHPNLESTVLYRERLVAAVPAAHPLARREQVEIAELREEQFVSVPHRDRGGLSYLVAERCIAHGFYPRVARATSRKNSLLSLVNAGFGIAVVPQSMASISLSAGVSFPAVKDADFYSEVALLRRRDAPAMVDQFVQAFIQGLRAAGLPAPDED